MSRSPHTGMERLLRLRELQIARARSDSATALNALQQAEGERQYSLQQLATLSGARHQAQAESRLDLARYSQLVEGERVAVQHWSACEHTRSERQRETDAANEALQQRVKQAKAVEQRHRHLRQSLQHALDSKQEGQLADLWLRTRSRP